MQTAPALTPERIDAMLAAVAEVCLDGVTEAGVWIKAAVDVEAFERASRALQTHCRNLRQTIAMKQRFDRELVRAALEARRVADEDRKDAAADRKSRVGSLYWRARTHLGDLIWNEYEEDEAQAIFNDVDERLSDLSEDDPDAFLQTPFETLIARFSEDLGIGAFKPAPEPPAPHKGYDPPPPGSRYAAQAALSAPHAKATEPPRRSSG